MSRVSRSSIIYGALVKAAEAGERCPSNDVLGERAGVRFNSVPGILDRLAAEGLIRVERFQSARIVEIVATGRRTTLPEAYSRRVHVGAGSKSAVAPSPPSAPAAAPLVATVHRRFGQAGPSGPIPIAAQQSRLEARARSRATGLVGMLNSVRAFGNIGPAPKSCRFPLWGDETVEPRPIRREADYCGEPVVEPGKPYCAYHQGRCWTKPADPVRHHRSGEL